MLRRMALLVLAALLTASAGASGRYAVNAGGVAALVDEAGGELLAPGAFESIFAVREGALYAAGSAGDYDLYDADGGYVSGPFEMLAELNGAVIFRRGVRFGALDGAGGVLIAPSWTQLTAADPDRYLALATSPLDEQPDEVYALSASGEVRATGVLVDGGLSPFREGRMPFRAPDGRYGCLNAEGEAVIPAGWAWLGNFEGGAAIVSDGAMYGLVDPDGAVLISPRFTWLQRGEGLLLGLREDGALELLTPGGDTLCEIPEAGEVQAVGPWAAARRAEGVTLYDREGAALAVAAPDAVLLPGLDGQVIAVEGDRQTLLDPDGSAVSGPWPRILPLIGGRYAVMTFGEDPLDASCGLMDASGALLLEPVFEEILPAGPDRLILVGPETVAFADLNGNPLATWSRR